MFWSDPNLYGVTLPYRDIANPMATGLHNIPRFLPPTYGFTTPYITPQVLPQGLLPTQYAQQTFNPMVQPFGQFIRPEMVQQFGQFFRPELMQPIVGLNPYTQAYNFTPQPIVPFRPYF